MSCTGLHNLWQSCGRDSVSSEILAHRFSSWYDIRDRKRRKFLRSRHLVRIVSCNKQIALIKITFIFNAGDNRCITSRSIEHSLASIGYQRRAIWVPLLSSEHWTQHPTWAHDITNWKTGNVWYSLMNHGSSCFRLVVEFGCSTNLRLWVHNADGSIMV